MGLLQSNSCASPNPKGSSIFAITLSVAKGQQFDPPHFTGLFSERKLITTCLGLTPCQWRWFHVAPHRSIVPLMGRHVSNSCFLGRPQKATILSMRDAMRKILLVLGFQLRFVRGDERANVVRHIQ